MKNNIFFILLIFLLAGCNGNKNIQEKGLPISHNSITLNNGCLGKPGPIIYVDNKIVGIDYMLDSCFFYVNIQNDSLYRFGTRGQGPNEFIYPYTLQHLNDTSFAAFDLNAKKFCLFHLENNTINVTEQYSVINAKSLLSFDFKKISNNSYLGFGPYPQEMFIIIDTLGKVKRSFFEFPYKDKNEKKIKNDLRAMAYQGLVNFNISNNKLLYAPTFGDIIHVYQIDQDNMRIVYKQENSYPVYKTEENADSYSAPLSVSNVGGYISSSTTSKYFYLLYSGTTLKDLIKTKNEFSGNTVIVYNWVGEKVKTFSLDIACKNICVTPDDKLLYAIAENPEPELVYFNLPNL